MDWLGDPQLSDDDVIARYQALPIDHDSKGYWKGCASKTLVISRCVSCGYWIHFPRPMCPKCWSENVENQRVVGDGRIYTFILFNQADGRARRDGEGFSEPYAFGVVELIEQSRLRIPAPIVNCSPDSIRVGMDVRLAWIAVNGSPVPAFEPRT